MNVYDFDNTIYDGESCFDLFKFYMKRDPSLIKLFPQVVKAFAKYKKGEVTLEQMVSEYAPIAEEKLAKIDFENEPRQFWDKHMHKIKPFYKEIQKDDDLIITASPDFHIEEVAKRLGINNFLTSKVDKATGKIEFICIRQNKITAFKEKYGECDIENFYTDSSENDAPLIALAKNAYVVKKNKITKVN